MILRPINLFHFLFLALFTCTLSAQEFRCNELLGHHDKTLLTYEYTNPSTKFRGVACVVLLNEDATVLLYLEEEVEQKEPEGRKQAVARAQLQSVSFSERFYTGIIHVTKSFESPQSDIFGLDNAVFTLSVSLSSRLITFTINSSVYIWQPRDFVPNWIMLVEIPKSCGTKSLIIHDPVPRPVPDRLGIICVLEDSPTAFRFFSFGWRRAGSSGRPRKFINFGSLRTVTPNFLNIFTGRIHAVEFPAVLDIPASKSDQNLFRDTLMVSAVRSVNTNSFMIYGDFQEVWFDAKIGSSVNPKYPLLPINLETDFSKDLVGIYGFPRL